MGWSCLNQDLQDFEDLLDCWVLSECTLHLSEYAANRG